MFDLHPNISYHRSNIGLLIFSWYYLYPPVLPIQISGISGFGIYFPVADC